MKTSKSRTRARPRPLRFAVIGLGHIAQAAVLPAFKHARPHAKLTALISGDRKKLAVLGKRYGVSRLHTYEEATELFASGEIDAAYIALPNSMHCAWTIRAASGGLHVLCEKPLASTVRDSQRMIDACAKNRVQLMTAYRLHFERTNLEVADIVRKGKIGEARWFDSQFSMQVEPDNIRLDRELGGGPEWDIGVYCINAARYVFAADPTEVWATASNSGDSRFREVPETVHCIMKLPGDRVANFVCSFGAAERSRYQVVGTKGSVVCDPAFHYTQDLGYQLTIGERTRKKTFAKRDQFAPELIHFVKAVRARRKPEPSGKEGLIDVAIVEAIHKSISSGKWVSMRGTPKKTRRPSLRHEMRRPAVAREPKIIHVEAPHG